MQEAAVTLKKINPYDSSFESEELCEEYCDWKNKKESCK